MGYWKGNLEQDVELSWRGRKGRGKNGRKEGKQSKTHWPFTNTGLLDLKYYSRCLYKYDTTTQYKHGTLDYFFPNIVLYEFI